MRGAYYKPAPASASRSIFSDFEAEKNVACGRERGKQRGLRERRPGTSEREKPLPSALPLAATMESVENSREFTHPYHILRSLPPLPLASLLILKEYGRRTGGRENGKVLLFRRQICNTFYCINLYYFFFLCFASLFRCAARDLQTA